MTVWTPRRLAQLPHREPCQAFPGFSQDLGQAEGALMSGYPSALSSPIGGVPGKEPPTCSHPRRPVWPPTGAWFLVSLINTVDIGHHRARRASPRQPPAARGFALLRRRQEPGSCPGPQPPSGGAVGNRRGKVPLPPQGSPSPTRSRSETVGGCGRLRPPEGSRLGSCCPRIALSRAEQTSLGPRRPKEAHQGP